jgi:preprotein translocase subunit SecG
MEILLTIIHLAACFILIVIVLLQKGKGADLAGAFGGGGSQTNMGVRTNTQMVHKLTIAAAVFFMVTSYTLGLVSGGGGGLARAVGRQAERTQSTQQQTETQKPAATAPTTEEKKQDDAASQDATDKSDQTTQPEADSTPSEGSQQPSSDGNN